MVSAEKIAANSSERIANAVEQVERAWTAPPPHYIALFSSMLR